MSQRRETPKGKLQPQLPLLDGMPDDDHRRVPTASDRDRDWHLDAHTCEVGRRGIAAARAQLRNASSRAA